MSLFPSSLTVSFAWAATVADTLFWILLIAGFKIRMASVLSGLLLLSFAMGMVTGLGIKTPFDYSVFSAAAAAFLLDRKSTRLNSSHLGISYAVFCLKKKNQILYLVSNHK